MHVLLAYLRVNKAGDPQENPKKLGSEIQKGQILRLVVKTSFLSIPKCKVQSSYLLNGMPKPVYQLNQLPTHAKPTNKSSCFHLNSLQRNLNQGILLLLENTVDTCK